MDHHLADNFISLLVLLDGRIITSKITVHIRSNMCVWEKFLHDDVKIGKKRNEIMAEYYHFIPQKLSRGVV